MRLQMQILRAASVAPQLLARLYGLFFVAIGAVFVYWSGRGLLAYANGIRAAWAEPGACIIGLIVASLSFWVGTRMVRKGIPAGNLASMAGISEQLESTMEEAMTLERTDPAASRRLLDDYFTQQASATEVRRADLRHRAQQDINAALALREELREEVKNNALLRKNVLARWPPEQRPSMLLELDAAESQLKAELLQLDGQIAQLKQR
jgi:hypothetical protein